MRWTQKRNGTLGIALVFTLDSGLVFGLTALIRFIAVRKFWGAVKK